MAFPVFRHHDAAQVRVAQKTYSEQIKQLALKEIGGWPYRSDGLKRGVISGEAYFQPYPLFPLDGEKVIRDFKERLTRIEVGAGHVREEICKSLVFQAGAGFADGLTGDKNCQLIAVKARALDGVGPPGQKVGHRCAVL